MSIRPVSRRFPTSGELMESTNLPFCAVLTPCEEIIDGETNEEESSSPNNNNNNNTFSHPMSVVPKCLFCGAPHPTSTTHFRPSKLSSRIFCYLCGETSSTMLTDQQTVRDDEDLDPDTYDKISFRPPTEKQGTTDTIEFRIPVEERKRGNGIQRIWQLPAMACPPVWWIVVDGTVGTGSSISHTAARNYWSTVEKTLRKALENVPPHVHVGLITATGSRLANWDLTSAVPRVQQFPYSYDPVVVVAATAGDDDDEEEKSSKENPATTTTTTEAWDLCLVPANGHYKANLEAAIRAMVDAAGSGLFLEEGQHDDDDDSFSSRNAHNVPLGLTLEILLEFMEQASHPGLAREHNATPLKYAGGKILCLLGNPPLETATPPNDDSKSYEGQSAFGAGGVAGGCRAEDEDEGQHRSRSKSKKPSNDDDDDDEEEEQTDRTDMTPSNLKDYVLPLEPDDLFVKVGRRCAEAALGVDLVVLVPEEDDDDNDHKQGLKQMIPWYGLPLLRPLSDSSGAPGPLMFGTANVDKTEEPFERLFENVIARTPWQSGMVFGVQMRLRLSPGFILENSTLESVMPPKKGKGRTLPEIKLASMLESGGLQGPAIVPGDGETEDETKKKTPDDEADLNEGGLWAMGTCDPYTSFTVDLENLPEIPTGGEMEGYGDVELKPVIQTCTLFTSIETDDADPTPNYYTICKIRVSSVALDYAEDMESIYDGVDPEALAVILTHKLVLDAYLNGLVKTQQVGEQWLQLVMKGLYESAKQERDGLEEEDDSPKDETDDDYDDDTKFVAGNRLLDTEGGNLDDTDIFMGQGHFKMNIVPLLVYGIINSDALRPCGGNFQPSMDARLCAISQMSSMTPISAAAVIAPNLSLWSLENDEPIIENLPLSKAGILNAMEKLGESIESQDKMVFLLESPQRVILFRRDELENGRPKSNETTEESDVIDAIGPNFVAAVLGALARYRTAPADWKALESFIENDGGDWNDIRVPPSILHSMLVEDRGSFGGDANFIAWKTKVANEILEAVREDTNNKKSRGGLMGLLGF